MKLRLFAAALALSVSTPVLADPASGFYAGLYGGGAIADNRDFDLYYALGAADGESTDGVDVIYDTGVDPRLAAMLDALLVLKRDAAEGVGFMVDANGALAGAPGPVFGAVAGYGFGNGLRVEADLSMSGLGVNQIEIDSAQWQLVRGERVDSIDWEWTVEQEGSEGEALLDSEYATIQLNYRASARFLLANAYYDLDTGTAFTPYLGAGLGVAQINTSLGDIGHSAFVPAGQLGAGVRVATGTAATIDLGYRLRVAGDPGVSITDTLITEDSGFQFIGEADFTMGGPVVMHAFQIGLTLPFN